jgi:hypothetical protein
MKAKCTFFIREIELVKGSKLIIAATVRLNGLSTTLRTGHEIRSRTHWKRGMVVGVEPYLMDIYTDLKRIKGEVEAIECQVHHTPKMVIQIYNGAYDRSSEFPDTLLKAIKYAVKVREENPRIAESTTRDYMKVYNVITRWLDSKGWDDIPLKQLRKSHVREYANYVGKKNETGINSTVWYHYCVINLAINCVIREFSEDEFMIPVNTIAGAISRPDPVEARKATLRNHLTKLQVEEIEGMVIEDHLVGKGRLPKVHSEWYRQVVLFQIYSGFSFVDMGHDNWSYVKNMNGLDMILLSRGKNGQEANIPITPELRRVIEKLKGFGGDRLFPFRRFVNPMNYKDKDKRIYEAEYASYANFLKRLGKMMAKPAKFTSHSFRHTFAMRMLNDYGMSIESLASMMGHSDIKTAQTNYAYISQDRVANEFLNKSA